jgi:hypothetical protein
MIRLLVVLLLTGCAHREPISVSPEAAHAIARMVACEKVEKDADERRGCE